MKTEMWWRTREAFRRSWELLRHLDGHEDGLNHPLDEVVLMCEALARQLNTPQWGVTDRGKIIIEGKKKLAVGGIKPPDRADACVMTRKPEHESFLWLPGMAA